MDMGGTLAHLMRARQDCGERRQLHRYPGTGLVARFGDRVVEVLDISLGGLRLAPGYDVGAGEVRFRIARRGSGRPEPDSLGASATAVKAAATGNGQHLRFVGMNYPLARLVIGHIAAVSGVSPYIFR